MSSTEAALQSLDEAIRIIDQNSGLADFESGASSAEIDQAEELLGVKLSNSYIQFLLRYGAGDFNGREFFGVVPGHMPGTSAPSAVWFTLDERKVSALPLRYVVVGSSGYGSLFCLDTSSMSNGESTVVEWDKSPKTKVADSFGSFILAEIKSSLDD